VNCEPEIAADSAFGVYDEPREIEAAVAHFDKVQRERLERDLPIIMRNMAISAGAASLN
jgi:hypothetical protein